MIMQHYGVQSGALTTSLMRKAAELDDLGLFPFVMVA